MNILCDIGITTFAERFDMLQNLIKSIRKFNSSSNIIVNVNGNIVDEFNEEYRSNLYNFLALYPKTFLHVWPEFRSLAKGWNNCIISATTDNIIILNDDLLITSKDFFVDVENGIKLHNGLFRINENFGMIVVNRDQIHDIKYFDERLLGFGKEDADMMERYRNIYGTMIPSIESNHIQNLNSFISQSGFQKWNNTKFPLINSQIFNDKLRGNWYECQQYPYEKFYRKNRLQMINLTNINYTI